MQISFNKCCIVNIGKHESAGNTVVYKLGDCLLKSVESTSDLGIMVDPSLKFSYHVAAITKRAHARANLILRCFISGHRASVVNAFKIFVRPILEYNSSIWSPSSKQLIESLESVQRRFTKRIAGMYNLTYHQRLNCLGLESLELRRLRADLLLSYKILFGLTALRSVDFFQVNTYRNTMNLRGHAYQLIQPVARKASRHSFFANRIVSIWNNLPFNYVCFTSFTNFKNNLSTAILAPMCKVFFN